MKKSLLLLLAIAVVFAAGTALAQEVKDANPPDGSEIGVGVGLCGPDTFGYTCDDTVPFNFVDISGTGTPVVVGDDTSSGPLAIGGPGFDFYGTVYTSLVMAANGYISTDPTDGGPDLSNDCPLPATPSTGGGARIYPLHDDLDLESGIGQGYHQYFASCPRPPDRGGSVGCNIFQWNNVNHWPGGAGAPAWDLQVILYDTWDFTYQIGAGNPETGSGSTTGIQNLGATDGLTYACNTLGSIPDNTAITFLHPFAPVPTMDYRWLALMAVVLLATGALVARRRFA